MKDQHNTNWRAVILANVAFWLLAGALILVGIAALVLVFIRGLA